MYVLGRLCRRHMATPSLSEVLAACEASRDDFNNWNRRGFLRQRSPETRRGIARQMTRRSALEVGFIAALTDVGVDVAIAAQLAHKFLVQERKGKLAPWLLINPVTGSLVPCGDRVAEGPMKNIFGFHLTGEGEIVADNGVLRIDEPEHATRYGIVHLAGLIKRIDKLFVGRQAPHE